MSKTRYEHLNTLPEPYKSRAINNYFKRLNIKHVSQIPPEFNEVKDLHYALLGAFDWFHSPEGTNYWTRLIDDIISGKIEIQEQTEDYSIY